jgi:hypothetical protein
MPETPTLNRRRSSVPQTELLEEVRGSFKRAPFPGWLPRRVKRNTGQNVAVPVPSHIRILGARLTLQEELSLFRVHKCSCHRTTGPVVFEES